MSYPLPGTRFHQMVSSQLGPKENWADSDDLDMMFQGAFTTEFYRALADALHLEVRRRPRTRRRGLGQRADSQELRAQAADMDLLLTHGYFLHEDPKELQIMKPYRAARLALPFVVPASARASTWRSTIPPSARARSCSGSWRRERPATLGIYANLMTRANALAIVERAAACGWSVVAGRAGAGQLCRTNIWRPARDYVVPGEGESHRALLSGEPLPMASSIATVTAQSCARRRAADSPISTRSPGRTASASISTTTCASGGNSTARARSRVITARGCPYHCRWCSHSTFGKTHRRRSAVAVVDEVEWILEPLPARDAVVRRRRLHHPPRLARPVCGGDAAPRHARSVRVHHARRPLDARVAERLPAGLLPRVDRLGERVAAHARRHGARRRTAQVREAVRAVQGERHRGGHVPHVGLRRREIDDIEATVEHVARAGRTCSSPPSRTRSRARRITRGREDRLVRIGEWATSTDRDIRIRGRHAGDFYQFADELLRAAYDGSDRRRRSARQGLRAVLQRRWKHEPPRSTPRRAIRTLWSATENGCRQRAQVWAGSNGLFPAWPTILDLGCGTGEDAVHFDRTESGWSPSTRPPQWWTSPGGAD